MDAEIVQLADRHINGSDCLIDKPTHSKQVKLDHWVDDLVYVWANHLFYSRKGGTSRGVHGIG